MATDAYCPHPLAFGPVHALVLARSPFARFPHQRSAIGLARVQAACSLLDPSALNGPYRPCAGAPHAQVHVSQRRRPRQAVCVHRDGDRGGRLLRWLPRRGEGLLRLRRVQPGGRRWRELEVQADEQLHGGRQRHRPVRVASGPCCRRPLTLSRCISLPFSLPFSLAAFLARCLSRCLSRCAASSNAPLPTRAPLTTPPPPTHTHTRTRLPPPLGIRRFIALAGSAPSGTTGSTTPRSSSAGAGSPPRRAGTATSPRRPSASGGW